MNFVPTLVEAEFRPPADQPSPLMASIEASVEARLEHLIEVERGGIDAINIELAICGDGREGLFYWFKWYAWTYDPRNALEIPPLPANLPFDLYPKQEELIDWFLDMMHRREDGCLKKSRDVGFTWLAGSFAWWHWRWVDGFKTTFGSRKSEYVDRIGDPDSIFEKIRLLYQALPKWMLPPGFIAYQHDNHMLMVNPVNGNTIRGEGGEEMGRGGRSTLYFIDEAAKIEHADRVDAATSGNTDVRIWGSSINPQNENNLFQRKYTSFPPERVFRYHYSDDPRKTPEWVVRKKASVTNETWEAEYEINDSYTVEDICIPQLWVKAAQRIKKLCHEKGIPLLPKIEGIAGGDVGGGKAQSVVIARFGAVVANPKSWTNPDTIDTALKMLDYCQDLKLPLRPDGHEPKVRSLHYDSIAIGQGVSATMKRNPRRGLIVAGVDVGKEATDTTWPDGEKAHEKFTNLKAEAWWTARERFKRTYEMVLWLEGKSLEEGALKHQPDDCIALPEESGDQLMQRLCSQLSSVKWVRTETGKVQMESKKSMAARGLASPDYADALILTFTGNTNAERWAAFAKVRV